MQRMERFFATTSYFILLLSLLWCADFVQGSQEESRKEIPECAVKKLRLPQEAFSIAASYFCYRYLSPRLFKPNARIEPSSCSIPVPRPTSNFSVVPCYRPPDGGKPVLFNHSDPRMLEIVLSTLWRSEDGSKWLRCSEAADECCSRIIHNAARAEKGIIRKNANRCPPQWDYWYCWADGGTPGTLEEGVCPDYIYSNKPPTCKHHHTKECFANGTWREITDYTTCDVTPRISARTVYHVAVLAISLVSTIPALIIFFSYRKLRVTRVFLHRTLIMAIAARNCFTIISSTTVILPELYASTYRGVMEENGVPCRVLSTFERLSANAVFACMLLEGFYLHRLIAAAMRSDSLPISAIITAVVLTFAPAIAWAAVMATLQDSNCWYVDSDSSGYQWINDGPRIAMLAVNTILLIDIARVMLTRLRSVQTASAGKLRMTAKATLLLMPLFGIQLLLTVARPNTDDCVFEQVYYFIAYTTDGLQGFFVVLIYCFLNKEVKQLLLRSWRVWSDKTGIHRNQNAADGTSRRPTLMTTLTVPKASHDALYDTSPRRSLAVMGEDDPGPMTSASGAKSVTDRRESHV